MGTLSVLTRVPLFIVLIPSILRPTSPKVAGIRAACCAKAPSGAVPEGVDVWRAEVSARLRESEGYAPQWIYILLPDEKSHPFEVAF